MLNNREILRAGQSICGSAGDGLEAPGHGSGLSNRGRFARRLSMCGLAGAGLSNVLLDLARWLSMCGLAGGLNICGLAGDGLSFSHLISANGNDLNTKSKATR